MDDKLPIKHLAHVALEVPDPNESTEFYKRVFGLVEVERRDGRVCLSIAPRKAHVVSHHDVVLSWGEEARVEHIALAVSSMEHLERAARTLSDRGVDVKGPEDFELGHQSLSFDDPDGHRIEVVVPSATVQKPATATHFDATKLGHVTRKSPNPPQQAAFWQEVMNFRLSDQVETNFFFLRCNPDHHTVAFARSEKPDTHHVAIEVSSWGEIKQVCDQLLANGVKVEYGPGRHGPGNNIFIYYRDPWGIRWEFFCEMSRIDDEDSYEPGYWEGGRLATVNRWGPLPPDSFVA